MSKSHRVWKHNHLEEPERECLTLEEYVLNLHHLITGCLVAVARNELEIVKINLCDCSNILNEMTLGEWHTKGTESDPIGEEEIEE